MSRTNFNELLEAGVHFGHLKRKWNPNMAPYIFGEKKGIHVIDLNKTVIKLDEAADAMRQIARSGRKILFVATKKQAKDLVAERVKATGMPYVTERWSGGMLTNFGTIRRAVKKMSTIDKMQTDGTFDNISKREKLQIMRKRENLEQTLGSIADMTRIPAAIFIVDIHKEHIALAEAKKLNIPTFAMVDTNSDPNKVDFPIPANDDATKSIAVVLDVIIEAVQEGLTDRKSERDKEAKAKEAKDAKAKEAKEAKEKEAKAAKEAKAKEEKEAKADSDDKKEDAEETKKTASADKQKAE